VYTSCGFHSNLKVQSSLARVVTVDSEVATKSRTLHTLTVCVLNHIQMNKKGLDAIQKMEDLSGIRDK
jgi:hypothetical protein